jgi:hypothetical protein
MAAKTFENKAEGRGNVERAGLTWLEDVENDSRETKLNRQTTNDGEDWACEVREGRTLK